MAWVNIHKNGVEKYRVTEESYELIFKEQGYTLCDENIEPKKGYESPEISLDEVGGNDKDEEVSVRSFRGRKRKG